MNNVTIINISLLLMSSINFTQKSKLSPLNLTSQAVHQILKQVPKQMPSMKKIYPTVKYATEQIRSTTDINSHIAKKIKELDRIYSHQKKPKSRPNLCKTQIANTAMKNHKIQFQEKNVDNLRGVAGYAVEEAALKNQRKTSVESMIKNSTEKYLDKINKIKNLKLKQYMRNKFAIDIKTIQTTRQQMMNSEQEKRDFVPIKASYRHPKTQYKTKMILKYEKDKQKTSNILNETSPSRSYRELNDSKEDAEHTKMLEIKLEKIMKKTENFDKTQVAERRFQFSREFEENPAEIRFERMLLHLAIILYSYGCTREIPRPLAPFTRNCSKYTFFVGSGNNKNLIISIMKKRWWWTETHSMSDANFVWTQLKQSKVLEVCKKYPSRLAPAQISPQKLDQNTASLRKNKQKLKEDKRHKLFHSRSKIKQFDEAELKKINKDLKAIEIPKKLHNHYQGNSALGNKKALFYFISLYCQYRNIDRYDYIPLTFHISSSRSPEIKNLEKAISSDPSSYWLIKPGQNSNRGKGIYVTKSLTQIKQHIKNLTTNTLIIQKYIDNLFLYCCRKFDIRTYMIAVTIAGSTKFYWHSQGYLRTSSYIYNLKDHENLFVHLTNDAIQSTDDKYSKYEQGNKLSYQQFQRYLDQNYRNKSYSIKSAHEQMKNIAKLAVQATYPQINSSKLQFGFEVFGLDFILDSNFRPWLIQVNTNPCLELCSPCLQRLIPQMIENAFRIAVDTVFQPCVEFPRSMSSAIPDNILLTNRFNLIFDDLFDTDQQWNKKLNLHSLELSKDQEQQQTFEGDGQIVKNI